MINKEFPFENKIRKILNEFKKEIENPQPPPAHTKEEWLDCIHYSYAYRIAKLIYRWERLKEKIKEFVPKKCQK